MFQCAGSRFVLANFCPILARYGMFTQGCAHIISWIGSYLGVIWQCWCPQCGVCIQFSQVSWVAVGTLDRVGMSWIIGRHWFRQWLGTSSAKPLPKSMLMEDVVCLFRLVSLSSMFYLAVLMPLVCEVCIQFSLVSWVAGYRNSWLVEISWIVVQHWFRQWLGTIGAKPLPKSMLIKNVVYLFRLVRLSSMCYLVVLMPLVWEVCIQFSLVSWVALGTLPWSRVLCVDGLI